MFQLLINYYLVLNFFCLFLRMKDLVKNVFLKSNFGRKFIIFHIFLFCLEFQIHLNSVIHSFAFLIMVALQFNSTNSKDQFFNLNII